MIKERFHRSELYLSLLLEHARPGVNGLSSEQQPEFHASKFGFQRVLRDGLYTQEHLAQALQITFHTLHTRRDPSTELAWALASSTHVPDRIVGQRQDYLEWLEHKANQIKEIKRTRSKNLTGSGRKFQLQA